MAVYTNVSGGMLVLPDGTEIPKGEEAEISADTLKASGVAVWLKDGWLVKAKTAAQMKAEAEAEEAEAARLAAEAEAAAKAATK